MLALVVVLQVLVALFLIMVVLLQPGNRGGASAALGGAGSDTVFGGRGANTFLSKITFGAAVCFMVTNFALSYMSSSAGNKSVLDALEKSSQASSSAPSKVPASDKPAEGTLNQEEGMKAEDAGEAGKLQEPAAAPNGENVQE
ncbi:MAG: preprotein translocase subunit SecG [Myxococcales bacterium]|nr:MAG: preprotein translocase subunit SecG [Myxococcales bacterium]